MSGDRWHVLPFALSHTMSASDAIQASVRDGDERPLEVDSVERMSQRRDSGTLAVQRQFEAEAPVCRPDDTANPARVERLDDLERQINVAAQENRDLRTRLDSLQQPGPDRERLQHDLDQGRLRLLNLLEERLRLLEEEIESLQDRTGPNPACSAEHPEMTDLGNQLNERIQQMQRTQQQIAPLRRWHMRYQIGQINEQIAAIDAELATLPQVCDSGDPVSMLLHERRAELEQQRNNLAAALTGSAHEYEQFDRRWGAQRYGNSPDCTNIAQAGCGPTSLAIVLNYLYQEDPESLASGGQIEIVTPPQTATYAATHGRICNNGTAGDTMVTNVHTGFPGFRGRRISLDRAVDLLRSGNLVIFLCRGCTGQNRRGGDKSYGGHYMVLNGVNADGSVFNVLDPGANEASDILTITRKNLASHNAGFWIIERI
ncbi:MAG: hypothetical protein C0183_01635 [Roseiflexus castenholzii]|nr:MAG: hypothetical protein C0183_01635 [Roseiflexus castenholzii]